MQRLSALVGRLRAKAHRGLQQLGFAGGARQLFVATPESVSKPYQMLIVADGDTPIPPSGWGAVETIIAETIPHYEAAGFGVTVLNSMNWREWRAVQRHSFDVILLHGIGKFVGKTRRAFRRTPIVAVNHFGFAAFPDQWNESYHRLVRSLDRVDAVCCLAESIRAVMHDVAPEVPTFVSSNGSAFAPEVGRHPDGPYLCIGVVQPRKRQFELFQSFREAGVPIHFAGFISDPRVRQLLDTDPQAREAFLWGLTRTQLAQMLKRYRAVVLPSLGEADALVLYEAQLAGLPVFTTQRGLGAQDSTLPWVKVIDHDATPASIEAACATITHTAGEIAAYAQANYSWSVRNRPLLEVLLEKARSGLERGDRR
jgi:glycosyltransferase involved in cell wall biosynthesis